MRIRRLLLILLVLVVVAVVVAAISVNRVIDANKAEILAGVQQALGRTVQVGGISVNLLSPGIQLTDVTVADDPAFSDQPFLAAGEVSIRVAILPLLEGWLEIPRFSIQRPSLRIIRGPGGEFNFGSLGHRRVAREMRRPRAIELVDSGPAPTIAPGSGQGGGMDLKPAIVALNVDDGQLTYEDRSVSPAAIRTMTQLTVKISDIQRDRQVRGSVTAAVDGSARNVDLSGTFGPQKDADIPVTVRGSLGPIGAEVPRIEDLDLSAVLKTAGLDIDAMKGRVFGGSIVLNGKLAFAAGKAFTAAGTASGLELRQLGAYRGAPLDIDGKAGLDFELQGRGDSEVVESLKGKARIEVADGVLHRFNLVSEVVNRVSGIPGLVTFVSSRVKEKYAALLNSSETRFSKLQATFHVADQVARTDDAVVEGDDFGVTAAGTLTLARNADLRGTLRLSPALSQDIVADVKEVEILEDGSRRIALPFRYRGILGQARPEPDAAVLERMLGRNLEQLGQRLLDLLHRR